MLFSRKDLWRILFPLFIEQILAVTIGMLDTMMVSSAGDAAVSGVSLVDSINILLSNIFAALATGGAVVCSQFLGRKDFEVARTAAKQLIYTTFLAAFSIMAVALLFRGQILSLIFGKVSGSVMKNARIYFLFTALSYPFLALYNSGAAIFRSMGNSKISMYASLLMNLVNISGNALLIFIFHLGAAGAAIATLVSRIVGAMMMIVLLHNKNNTVYVEKILSFTPNYGMIRNILSIGIPSGMENGMFQFGKLLTQSLVSTYSTAAIAANAVANTLASFVYAAGGAFSLALITIIGRCIGAGEKKQAKQYTYKLLGIEYAVMFVVILGLTVFAKQIIGVYNLTEESNLLAFRIVLLHNICAAVMWPVAFSLPNCFRAANDVTFALVISVSSMWVFRVAFGYVFALSFGLGVMGVWVAMMIDWVFRTVMFVIHFARGKWLTKYKTAIAR